MRPWLNLWLWPGLRLGLSLRLGLRLGLNLRLGLWLWSHLWLVGLRRWSWSGRWSRLGLRLRLNIGVIWIGRYRFGDLIVGIFAGVHAVIVLLINVSRLSIIIGLRAEAVVVVGIVVVNIANIFGLNVFVLIFI